jgi:DNA-binding XRE family transcriptional regulator
MRKPLEIFDMPPLTLEMHSELRGMERLLQRALDNCCSSQDLIDPHAAFEYARTYAAKFYDCFYSFYSQIPDPEYRPHWRPASETFAFQRLVQCIENSYAIRRFFASDPTRIQRIIRTISDHADGTTRIPDPNVAVSVSASTREVSIGEQIRQLREECRLTNEQLAEAVGISVRSAVRHIGSDHQPSKQHLAKYEKLFSDRLKRTVRIKTSL